MNHPFSFHTEIDYSNGVFLIEAQGAASPEQVQAMYKDVGAALSKAGLGKVLLDARSLTLNYTPDKVLEITGSLSDLFATAKLARLINLSDFRNDLIETFAQQNQLPIRSFTEREEAIDWLNAENAN